MAGEVVTLRVPAETLAQLENLARRCGETRTQVMLRAIEEVVARDEETRRARLEAARARLRPVAEAQSAFLDEVSVSDEWRTF